jgi:cyanophycinase
VKIEERMRAFLPVGERWVASTRDLLHPLGCCAGGGDCAYKESATAMIQIGAALSACMLASLILVGGTDSPSPAPTDTPTPPLTIFPRVGNVQASEIMPHGPGLLLMGGGDTVDNAVVWMHDTIVGSRSQRAGDVIVLRATGTNAYDAYFMTVAPFNSVRTVMLGRGATTADFEKAASYIDRAQGVFFAGGDQANYARWKGTPLMAAVQRVYDRGGVVGGTSAGFAILGEYVFDSVAGDEAGEDVEVTTLNAVADPSESIISFTHNLLILQPLRNIITDSHFVTRNRFGRLAVFLSRIGPGPPQRLMGVGLDARTAIVIDRHGIGTLMLEHKGGSALFVRPTQHSPIVPGRPFVARGLSVTVLDRAGQTYDFKSWCPNSDAPTYSVSIDGSKTPIYEPANPNRPPAGSKTTHC